MVHMEHGSQMSLEHHGSNIQVNIGGKPNQIKHNS